jgi:hypothetical protein
MAGLKGDKIWLLDIHRGCRVQLHIQEVGKLWSSEIVPIPVITLFNSPASSPFTLLDDSIRKFFYQKLDSKPFAGQHWKAEARSSGTHPQPKTSTSISGRLSAEISQTYKSQPGRFKQTCMVMACPPLLNVRLAPSSGIIAQY